MESNGLKEESMSDRPLPSCCVDGSCHPNYIGEDAEVESDCMRLPMGVRCGDCANIAKCETMFGKKRTDDQCDWFPRKFRRPMP